MFFMREVHMQLHEFQSGRHAGAALGTRLEALDLRAQVRSFLTVHAFRACMPLPCRACMPLTAALTPRQSFSKSMLTDLAKCAASSFLHQRFSEKVAGGTWREGRVLSYCGTRFGPRVRAPGN